MVKKFGGKKDAGHSLTAHCKTSFQIGRVIQADREFGTAIDNVINTVIKIPPVLPLATLLDSHRGGHDLGAVNHPNLPPHIGKK
jgi:hypothetical protein